MQEKLDKLRETEAKYFDMNAEIERAIDERKRTNEQLKNEFECLTEAIKQELEAVRLAEETAEFLDQPEVVAAPQNRDSILDSVIGDKKDKSKPVDPSAPLYLEVPDVVDELAKSSASNKSAKKKDELIIATSSDGGSIGNDEPKQDRDLSETVDTYALETQPRTRSKRAMKRQNKPIKPGKQRGGPNVEAARSGVCCAGTTDQKCLIF